jgi:class 3 adenylate cyclase
MARQFSPQVIQSLEEGGIDLEKEPSRTEICAIFIDICNSTSKVNQIKPTDFEASLGMFLDSVMQTFLKYDLTIDKFLGDGIMAFCNSPLPRKDFVIRTCLAALETKIILEKKQSELLPFWRSPLDIRIGIAVGECNVGFYGNKKYFKTFTAIGPVINKAARLCSIAHPNEIILDERTKQFLPVDFLVNELGHKDLKGFEKEQNQTYSLISHPLFNKKELRNPECPSCNQIMNLEFTDDGQCLLVCRNCCTTHAPFLSET